MRVEHFRVSAFQHILLATDLSDASESAFGVATALARGSAARLSILHVYEVSARTLACASPAVAERTWPGPIRVRNELDRIVTGLRATGIRAEGMIRFGAPAHWIAEVARQRSVDLVVTGTHGRRGLARLWYGSVAEQVLRRSRTPVLIVPIADARVFAISSRRRAQRFARRLIRSSGPPQGRRS
jgi:nucleotide-binding universal stress UspA family protein